MVLAKAIIRALRPKQWVKNVFLFAALFYSLAFLDVTNVLLSLAAFAVFCAVTSSIYIVNDIVDVGTDRAHPTRRLRPIASGALPVPLGITIAVALGIGGISAAFALSPSFALASCAYILLMGAYTFVLKHVPVLDCMTIALGFVIRVVAGGLVIGVPVSLWLILATFFLTFFLAVTKREQEARLPDAEKSRPSLAWYPPGFISGLARASLFLTIGVYAAYTVFSPHSIWLVTTVPIVVYGLVRYRIRTTVSDGKNDGPADEIFKDRTLLAALFLFAVLSVLIVWIA